MISVRIISALLTAFVFTSCDPGFAVILSNQSSVERNITLVNHEWGMYRDSIRLLKYEDKNNSILSFTALKATDTSQKKYSFVLPPGYDAILRSGIGAAYVPKRFGHS